MGSHLIHALRRPGLLGAWTLVLAVLCAQALGLAHQVLHLPGDMAHAHAESGLGDPHGHAGVWEHLKHSPLDESECRLYDQLAHDPGPVAELVIPSVEHWSQAPGSQTGLMRAIIAPHHFHARAPPHLG